MNVIYEKSGCKLIKHDRTSGKYKDLDGNIVNYQLTERLFNNFHTKRKTNQKNSQNIEDIDILRIKEFMTEFKLNNLFSIFSDSVIDEFKKDNIKLMNDFYGISENFNEFHGENNYDYGQVTQIGSQNYLIPPRCRFFNKSVENIQNFLVTSNKFDFIVIDPPFSCKYIKRLKKICSNKSYQMMTNQEILQIPIQNYTHKNSIVIIWCTNSDIHEKFIKDEVIDAWNLKLIAANWKWVKIDKSGETFCPFNGSKKPYERIFVAAHSEFDKRLELPDDLLIFSQPSSIHSHKLPLTELFHHLLPSEPKCLEIFARSLYKNFTSIGLECLKLQNVLLFDKVLLTGPELSKV